MISFSRKVKEELMHKQLDNGYNDIKSALFALFINSKIKKEEENYLELKVNNVLLFRNIIEKIKKLEISLAYNILIQEKKNFKKKNKVYVLRIYENYNDIFSILEINNINFSALPKYIYSSEKAKKIYVKYLFVAYGTMNDPKIRKQYHLEISNVNKEILLKTMNILEAYDINFKLTKRKNTYALYLNKGEEIADFLKFIGSLNYLFEFENYRLSRDIKATENRLLNAEIANETKKQINSSKQVKAIIFLQDNNLFETLKEKTQKIGKLRLQYPEESLVELVNLTEQDISKSNVRYHLTLIEKLAEKHQHD